MPGSGRGQSGQSKHDQKVREVAKDYKARGYDVSADIPGYQQPLSIGGYKPDVVAKKSGQETIIEVEMPDSANSARDINQQEAFRRAARQSEKRHYKRIITK